MPRAFSQRIAEELDYRIDWSRVLRNDTIVASTWTAPAELTVLRDTAEATATIIWVTGGSAGVKYDLTNQIQTAAGRVWEEIISVTFK